MNHRIFYAIQQVGFAIDGTTTFVAAHGVKSVGITTNFALEQVFEVGQLDLYQLVEGVPEIQVQVQKDLDGYPLIYHLATNGSTVPGLVGRAPTKCLLCLSVFNETQTSASGAAIAEVQVSGLYTSSLNYTFGIDGPSSEQVSLVGVSKIWRDVATSGGGIFSGAFTTDADVPLAYPSSGGVQNRWNVLFAGMSGSPTGVDVNGAVNAYCTVLPTEIYGVSSSGTNGINADGSTVVPVQSIAISCDLGRQALLELGKKSPYIRYVNFPVEVRSEIEVLALKMDNVSATEAGGQNGAPAGYNLLPQTIRVQMEDGTRIDTGTNNKLQSVTWSGGDATQGGSNVMNRYSYVTYNTLNVYHPQDPSALTG